MYAGHGALTVADDRPSTQSSSMEAPTGSPKHRLQREVELLCIQVLSASIIPCQLGVCQPQEAPASEQNMLSHLHTSSSIYTQMHQQR